MCFGRVGTCTKTAKLVICVCKRWKWKRRERRKNSMRKKTDCDIFMCCVLKHNIALACRSSVGWFLTLLNNSVKQLFSCVVNSSASFLWAKIHFENKCSNILSNWYIQVRIFARKKKEWMLAGSIYFNIWKTFRLTAHHHLWLALSGNILNQTHSNFFLQTEFILIVFFSGRDKYMILVSIY